MAINFKPLESSTINFKPIQDDERKKQPPQWTGFYSPNAVVPEGEVARAITRGVTKLAASAVGTYASIKRGFIESSVEDLPPSSFMPGYQYTGAAEKLREEQRPEALEQTRGLRDTAAHLYRTAETPHLQQQMDGIAGYILNTSLEALPILVSSAVSTPLVGPAGPALIGYASYGEQAYQEAMQAQLDAGVPEDEAIRVAEIERAVSGTINGALQALQFDQILKIGRTQIGPLAAAVKDRAYREVAKQGAKITAESAARVAAGALSEGLQEATLIGTATMHGDRIEFDEDLERIGMAALGGATVTAFYGGIGAGVQRAGRALGQARAESAEAWAAKRGEFWSQWEAESAPVEEITGWFEPQARVMPEADVTDAVADTGIVEDIADRPRPVAKEQAEPDLTPEETSVLARLEAEEVTADPAAPAEDAGTVRPELYIGNVTKRAKQAWAEAFNEARKEQGLPGEVQAEDVKGHTEKGFPTKRTEIELTRDQATETLAQCEEALDTRLEAGEWTGPEIAVMNALWGDIKALRSVLGHEVGRMPFRVRRAARKPVVEIQSPIERTYAAIRGPDKATMAKWTPNDLVTQAQALKAKLKAVAQAATKAYRQGSKEAVAKLRRDWRALNAKKRVLKMVRDYRSKLVRQITRPVGESVDPLYARAIRVMSEAMDSRNRTERTRQRIDGLKQALQADPETLEAMKSSKAMKLLERLGQTPLENISTEQLQDLANERIRLEREGRLRSSKTKEHRLGASITKELNTALDARPVKAKLGVQARLGASWFARTSDRMLQNLRGLYHGDMPISRMCRELDGGVRGAFTKFVWEPIKRTAVASRMNAGKVLIDYREFLTGIGADPALMMGAENTFALESGMTVKLTPFEQIGIYVHSLNPTSRSHLSETPQQTRLRNAHRAGQITDQQFYAQWFGYRGKMTANRLAELRQLYEAGMKYRETLGLTDVDIDAITKGVTSDPQLTAIADHITKYFEDRWTQIEQVCRYVGINPNELEHVARYLPLVVDKADVSNQADLLSRALEQFIPEDYLAEHKFLKKRKGAQQNVELDAQVLFMHGIKQVEHFLAMSPVLSRLSHAINDPDFRTKLGRATRGKGHNILSQWLIDAGRGRVMRESTEIAKMMHKLHRNGIIYALGFNIGGVVPKQVLSIFPVLANSPKMVPRFVSNVLNHMTPESFDQMRADVFEKSPMMKDRLMEHMFSDPSRKATRKALYRLFGKKWKGTDLSMAAVAPIQWVDQWTTLHAWKSAYDFATEDGASDSAATRYADHVVQETQPMARPEDLPHYFRGGSIAQWVNTFRNVVNKNLNYWIHDIYGARKRGQITNEEVMYRVWMSCVMPGLLFGFISRGFRIPDDPKEMAKDVALYGLGSPMLIGSIITGAVHGWGSSLGMAGAALQEPGLAMQAAMKGDYSKVLRHSAATLAMWKFPGTVTAQSVRTAQGAWDLIEGEADDYRRLLYSEWALKQNESESGGRRRRRSRRRRKRR